MTARAAAVKVFLAVDVGASGGRVLAATFDGRLLHLQEVHRFDNGPVVAAGHMYWDLLAQWSHIKTGLRIAAERFGSQVASVGVDTWGVDFGLVGRNDHLLGNPFHYRDPRTRGMMEQAFQSVSREEIFAETGIQFMELNTLYQLLAMQNEEPGLLQLAERLLMMPDLFHWLLTGQQGNEFTNATTTQFYNTARKSWAVGMLQRLGIPTHFLGPIVPPGTSYGPMRKEVAEATGLAHARVVLPGTHDTASAVVAVPALRAGQTSPEWCYLSSGTWSLMGVETTTPVTSPRSCQLNFTNEGGVGGTIRFLKNIAGLWLVQECRRIWREMGQALAWDQLVAMAQESCPLHSFIDPDDPCFVAPGDMPEAIRQFCHQTGQEVPQTNGAVIRCALESIALRYRSVLDSLAELTGARLETIHIVGGGAQNQLLCQMAADACRCQVLAGPVEATALGNALVQAITAGEIESVAEGRRVIRESFPVQQYEPQDADRWDEAYERFQGVIRR